MQARTQKHIKLILKGLSFAAIILILQFQFSSCSKNNDVDQNAEVRLSIAISGVTDLQVEKNRFKSANLQHGQIKNAPISDTLHSQQLKVDEFSFDIISQQTALPADFTQPLERLHSNSPLQAASGAAKAADIAMETGVKYWILLYNKTTKRFEISTQAIAGQVKEIVVVKNQEYDWYAYSFNTADEIPRPNLTRVAIESQTDKPLLFAKGSIKASQLGSNPLAITFQHQLAQLQVQVDARGMFGNIEKMDAKFAADYIKTGTFDLLTGTFTGPLTPVDVGNLVFTDLEAGLSRLKLARYYTADVSATSYGIKFSALNLRLINGLNKDLSLTFPNAGLVNFENYTGANRGKVLQGVLNMWKIFPRKKIMHVDGGVGFGYGASSPTVASGAFLRNPANFGVTSKYCRIDGFEHVVVSSLPRSVANALSNPADYPDIIIAVMFTGFVAEDYDAVYNYIDRGGVMFLMIENTNPPHVLNFMKKMFGQGVTISNYDAGGAMYTMTKQDAEVLSWPFGDVRGKYWGQDFSATLYVQGIPEGMVEVYSGASRNMNANALGASMFRHKTKNFFFVGDTGFLANSLRNDEYPGYNLGPFATNTNDFPVAHNRYGYPAMLGSEDYPKAAATWQAHNSVIFGNAFAFLVATSHYMGVNRSL